MAARLYIGVDVGGTKIQASLVEESGGILESHRIPTPRDTEPQAVVEAIAQAIEAVLAEKGVDRKELAAIGLAIPGVVDHSSGMIVVTPNMNLGGICIRKELEPRFGVPVALGNDCNLGALGESWIGAGRGAKSVFAMLVGTGIGAGFVRKGKLWRGAREAACEVGHIVMEIDGPVCGCQNRGCFEALAGRAAIERDIRAAVEAGESTVLTDILEGDLSVIRSGALRQALEAGDELVTRIVRRASVVIGNACLTIRHLIDPEVIVLGGGVIEACGNFMLPIIREIVEADKLPGARPGGHIRLSRLGDDAVVLGAVALARRMVGRNPFKKRYQILPQYPTVEIIDNGMALVGKKSFGVDFVVQAGGQAKKRKFWKSTEAEQQTQVVPRDLARLCRGGPEVIFIGTGGASSLEVPESVKRFAEDRLVELVVAPTAEAAAQFNACTRRKAGLFHLAK